MKRNFCMGVSFCPLNSSWKVDSWSLSILLIRFRCLKSRVIVNCAAQLNIMMSVIYTYPFWRIHVPISHDLGFRGLETLRLRSAYTRGTHSWDPPEKGNWNQLCLSASPSREGLSHGARAHTQGCHQFPVVLIVNGVNWCSVVYPIEFNWFW